MTRSAAIPPAARRQLMALVALLALVVPAQSAGLVKRATTRHESSRDFVAGEVLVDFSAAALTKAEAVLRGRGIAVEGMRALALPGLRLVRLGPGTSVPEATRALSHQPGVQAAEPNYILHLAETTPDDPRYPDQWALDNAGQELLGYGGVVGADIGAPLGWDSLTDSSAVKVGVVDDGIDPTHPDLAANVIGGFDFVGNDSNPAPGGLNGSHGTNVAGIIGAVGNNATGIAGVAWDASLMPLRIFDKSGSSTLAREVAAIGYAAAHGARLVNASYTGPGFSSIEQSAISSASNVLFVAAAGNDSANLDANPAYPCSYPLANIVCVAASDQADRLASFSAYGATDVDLAAPGTRILSTYPDGKMSYDLFEDFQTATVEGWATGGTRDWGLSDELQRIGGAQTNRSLADSPHSRYRNGTNSWARTPVLDFSRRNNCAASFYLFLDTQRGHDFLYVEASPNRHRWHTAEKFTGRSNGPQFVHLGKSVNQDPSAYLRFRLRSDGHVRDRGAYVDDLEVTCITTAATYGLNDGTSFSAPQVSGAAALLVADTPGATVAQVKAALLAGADPRPGLNNKVASDGRLDVPGALAALP